MLFWIKSNILKIQILSLLSITFKKLYMESPFGVQLQSSYPNFGIHEDHRMQAFALMSLQFTLEYQCVYMNKAIDTNSPIFYHSSTTFCSLDFCMKSADNCILYFPVIVCNVVILSGILKLEITTRCILVGVCTCLPQGIEWEKKKVELLLWGRQNCKKFIFFFLQRSTI